MGDEKRKYESDLIGDANENYWYSEDELQNGEFITSYFKWIPIAKQKQRADELDKMTKKKSE